ncbi:MAG: DUF58 domain-containing protein [Eubacterium sp.]|nr:DUF58 domain-containing protein [Eubacterium sp.]
MQLVTATIIIFLVFAIQKYLYVRFWDKGLDATCRFSRDFIECGESADLKLVVTNDKNLPLPIFQMKFSLDRSLKFDDMQNAAITDKYHKNEVFALNGRQKVTRKVSFTGRERGVVELNNVSMIVKDFFMTQTFAKVINENDIIYVFPKKKTDVPFNMFFHGVIGNIETRRSLIEDRLTFRGIRQYQPHDGLRAINWKQSAKSRELMVNVRGYTMDCEVRILLNLDTNSMVEAERLMEEAISIASSCVRRIINAKMAVSLYVNAEDTWGREIKDTGSGADVAHAITIDKALTEIKHTLGIEPFLNRLDQETKEASDNIHYLIISSYHKDDLIEKVDRLHNQGAGVTMVVPYYDAYPYDADRPYITGWEVPINA